MRQISLGNYICNVVPKYVTKDKVAGFQKLCDYQFHFVMISRCSYSFNCTARTVALKFAIHLRDLTSNGNYAPTAWRQRLTVTDFLHEHKSGRLDRRCSIRRSTAVGRLQSTGKTQLDNDTLTCPTSLASRIPPSTRRYASLTHATSSSGYTPTGADGLSFHHRHDTRICYRTCYHLLFWLRPRLSSVVQLVEHIFSILEGGTRHEGND